MKCIYIIILLIIVLFLLLIDLLIIKKREHFNPTSASTDNIDLGTIHDFVDYSKNSDKLLDMFKSLDDIENKCQTIDEQERIREEKEQMRINDNTFKELEEQDKKISELKDIIKYLTIEKKRRDKINSKCRSNTQIKLNENYNYLNKLNRDGLLKDNSVNLDLNISDSLKKLNLNSNITKNNNNNIKYNKIRRKSGDINVDNVNVSDKCYGCNTDKLKKINRFLSKDFK
jgi:hypothetical protein